MKWMLPKKMTYDEFKMDYMDSIGGEIWYARVLDNGYTQDQRYSFRWKTADMTECPEWDDDEYRAGFIDEDGDVDEYAMEKDLVKAYYDNIKDDIEAAYDAYLEWYEEYEKDVLRMDGFYG